MMCASCKGSIQPRVELRTGHQVYLCGTCGATWRDHLGAALLRLSPRLGPDADPLADLERRGGHLPLKLGRRSPRSEFRYGIRPEADVQHRGGPFVPHRVSAFESAN